VQLTKYEKGSGAAALANNAPSFGFLRQPRRASEAAVDLEET